jgi:hypothetical protein
LIRGPTRVEMAPARAARNKHPLFVFEFLRGGGGGGGGGETGVIHGTFEDRE